MHNKVVRSFAEPLGLLGVGAFLIQISRRHEAPATQLMVAAAEHSVPVVQQWQFIYGVLFILLALGSYVMSRSGRSLTAELLQQAHLEIGRLQEGVHACRMKREASRWWLASALLIGIALRLYFIRQPMRYDESVTFMSFVKGGLSDLFNYLQPNNNVLYTILEKLSIMCFGSSPAAIRLPALLFGVLIIPLTYGLCRKLDRQSTGIFAAMGVAISPFLVLYSTNGRGYTLLALLTLLIPYITLEDDGTISGRRWLLPALLAALGMFAIPSMLYALIGLCLWFACLMLLQGRSWKKVLLFLGPCAGAAAFLTLLFYTPVAIVSGGLDALTSNRFVQPLPLAAFDAAIVPHVVGTVRDFSRSIPPAATALTALLAIFGLHAAFRRRDHALLLLLPCLLLGAGALFLLKRSIPFSRTWIYLIPFFLITTDAGLSRLCRRLRPLWRNATTSAITACTVLFAANLAAQDAIAAYPDTGRQADAAAAAQFLGAMLSLRDVVCAQLPADSIVAYYLWRDVSPQDFLSRPDGSSRLFFVRPEVLPQDGSRELKGAKVLFQLPDISLYEWTAPDQTPDFMTRSTCWSPARAAGL